MHEIIKQVEIYRLEAVQKKQGNICTVRLQNCVTQNDGYH